MPDIAWNGRMWGQDYKWHAGGDEWSAAWGGSEAHWFGSLYPRLHRWLPAPRILEIATGFGRWTAFLTAACDDYLGIDLSERCIEECRTRFATASHARFEKNDGVSLHDAPDRNFDLIFSFDSLVHAERDVLEQYVPQMLRKLAPGGVAFIHHSNLLALMGSHGEPPGIIEHSRARSVSASVVADLVKASDGVVLVQEVINWVNTDMIDAMTTFAQPRDFPGHSPIHLVNPRFMDEASAIRDFHSPYGRIPRAG
jgi:SAM-dependent methyltransferase